MRRMPWLLTGAIIGVVLAGGGTAGAGLTIVHQGNNDPVTEGWTFVSNSLGNTVSGGTETTGSGTHDFWNVTDVDTTGYTTYISLLTPADLAMDWRFTAIVRVISAPPYAGGDVGTVMLVVYDGLDLWSFYLRDDMVGPVSA